MVITLKWKKSRFPNSYFLQLVSHSYVLSRNRLNSNIWYHYLITFINNFPMTCQSIQYDMIYIFWPFKFHYKKLEILKNLNSQNENATSRSWGCFQSPLHISHLVWECVSIPLFEGMPWFYFWPILFHIVPTLVMIYNLMLQ